MLAMLNKMASYCVKGAIRAFLSLFLILLWLSVYGQKVSDKAVLVKTTNAKEMLFYDPYNVVGKVENSESQDFFANTVGKITFITSKQGSFVSKGDNIISIYAEMAESMIKASRAKYNSAKLSYDRGVKLVAQDFESKDSLEKLRNNLEIAESDLRSAEIKYRDMIIGAPFDGVIGSIDKKIGDDVKVGDYLFSIIGTLPSKRVVLHVPQRVLQHVSLSTNVFIPSAASEDLLTNEPIKIKISSISKYIAEDSGNSTVICTTEDAPNLLHGAFVNAELRLYEHMGVALPIQAVQRDSKGSYIYIVRENLSKRKYVNVGISLNNYIEILGEKIEDLENVVLEGTTKLYDGARVQFEYLEQ